MTRKRWKLIARWTAAFLLAFFATGAIVFYSARAAVVKDARCFCCSVWGCPPEPIISFERVRFSNQSWVVIEFKVDMAEYDTSERRIGVYEWKWGLREWEVVPHPLSRMWFQF